MTLTIHDINKSFGDKQVLFDVSFDVKGGRAMGFLGRNGAGKSTTIRCLMDVFRQDSGSFLLDGKPFVARQNKIGYLPEERGMYAKSMVLDQLVYFAMLRGADKKSATDSANHWINYFGLTDYAKKPLETLSKGNQQKIQIAQAFLNDPDILILDEPFSGLDPVNAQAFKDAIRTFAQQGKLVIFSSHQMSYVEEMCDDIALINAGRILLTGDLDQIKRDWGKEQLALTVSHADREETQRAIDSAFPRAGTRLYEDMIIIGTKESLSQKEMLTFLAGHDVEVLSFGPYLPSLNDIFVQKVGEQA